MKETLPADFIQQIVEAYDIGRIRRKPIPVQGDVDLNYKVLTSEGTYILKYIQDVAYLPQFEFMGSLHATLLAGGVPVPRMYKSKADTYVYDSCTLYQFVKGSVKRRWSEEELRSLVRNFAHMGKVLETVETPAVMRNMDDVYTRGQNIAYSRQNVVPEVAKLPVHEEVKQEVFTTISLLEEHLSGYDSLPKQIIHSDLNESNALFSSNKNVAIIDLALAYQASVYDLGIFIYWWAFPWWTREFNQNKLKLILAEYNRASPLSDIEKRLLPYLVLRRSYLDLTMPFILYMKDAGHNPLPGNRLRAQVKRNQEVRNTIPKLSNLLSQGR